MRNHENPANLKIVGLFVTLLLALLPFGSAACAKDTQLQKPPFAMPFETHRGESRLETKLRIIENQSYSFALRFMYKKDDQVDRARVRKLSGGYETDKTGKLIDPGAPIQLKLSIFHIRDQEQILLYEREIAEQPLYSWGGDSLNKKIADISLAPGDYKVCIENLRAVPELQGTTINFVIGVAYHGK